MSNEKKYGKEKEFIERISKLDRAERAALKRCSGSPLSEARGESLGVFYQCLPYGTPIYQEEVYFIVATLIARFKNLPEAEWINNAGSEADLGWSLRITLREKGVSTGRDAKFKALLDTRLENQDGSFHHKLHQLIRLVDSKEVPVNWLRLLNDLLFWNSHLKSVQKRWARNYFTQLKEDEDYAN